MTDPPAEHFVRTCDELLHVINQYVDGDIDPDLCEGLDAYMGRCNPCRVVVDNIRRTVRMYHDEQIYEMPLDCRRRLHECLRQRWNQIRDGSD